VFDYVNVVVYQSPGGIDRLLREARAADLVVKHSGVGDADARLERDVLLCRQHGNQPLIAFWDVDAPATLARVEKNERDPFRELIPQYDAIFTYGGGEPICSCYRQLGAKVCCPIYNGLDPETHYPVEAEARFRCDFAFVGNRLPDRERRVENFFLRAAELAPEMSFILGGEGWGDKAVPANVRKIGHVATDQHNVVNCSARMVLNINRDSMADVGFSPPTRVFEAAGAGACLITDAWAGIGEFFLPEEEILLACGAEDIVDHLRHVTTERAKKIGENMRQRALRDHTYARRAVQVEQTLQGFRRPVETAP
jgi:spore maturation protein CgeB